MGFSITPINVRSGRVSINGVFVSVEDITAEFKTDRVEVTGTEDQHADGRTPQNTTDGIDAMTATFTATVDANDMPSVNPGLVQGAYLQDLRFYLDKTVAPRYCGATWAQVFSVQYQGRLKDAWKIRVSVESSSGWDCTIKHPT
jgi:hypothetical protein